MLKHLFFDLDKTLTPSRSEMKAEHLDAFEQLCHSRDVIVVSGAEGSQIRAQIPKRFSGMYYMLAQNGNHAIDKSGANIWKEDLDAQQTAAISVFIEQLKKELGLQVKNEADLIENRGAQISYSLIGHHEDLQKKADFDPDFKKRLAILNAHAHEVDALKKAHVEVKTAGTTCFDFFPLGKNKGFNILQFIERLGWKKEDSLYIGDALFPGGNDESVIGVIATHAVKDQDETFDFIQNELLSS